MTGVALNATPRPLYSRESEPVPIVLETGWAPEPVWTGAENNTEVTTVHTYAFRTNLFVMETLCVV